MAHFLAQVTLFFAAACDITNTVNTGRRGGSMSGLFLDVDVPDQASTFYNAMVSHYFFHELCALFILSAPTSTSSRETF